jgi:hypothetical protein
MNLYNYLQYIEEKYSHKVESNSSLLFSNLPKEEIEKLHLLPDLQNCSHIQTTPYPSFIITEDFNLSENPGMHPSDKEFWVSCSTIQITKDGDLSKTFTHPYLYLYSFVKVKDSLSDEDNYYLRYANINRDFIHARTSYNNNNDNLKTDTPKKQMHTKVKSNFERLLDILTPQQRMEMIQMGLNPFNEDHVNKYIETYKEVKYNFWQRIGIVWKYITSGIITEKMKTIVTKDLINDFDKLKTLPVDSDKYVGDYNTNTTPFVEKILKKEPSKLSHVDKNYKDELINIVQSKIELSEEKVQEEKKVKNTPESSTTQQPKRGRKPSGTKSNSNSKKNTKNINKDKK